MIGPNGYITPTPLTWPVVYALVGNVAALRGRGTPPSDPEVRADLDAARPAKRTGRHTREYPAPGQARDEGLIAGSA
jgi:hypothetical protein